MTNKAERETLGEITATPNHLCLLPKDIFYDFNSAP